MSTLLPVHCQDGRWQNKRICISNETSSEWRHLREELITLHHIQQQIELKPTITVHTIK